jgi:hypothetical protein
MLERKRGMVVANQSMVNHVRFNGIPKMGIHMRVREGVLIARNQSLVNPWQVQKGGTKKGVLLGVRERGNLVMNQSMVNLQYGRFEGGLPIGSAHMLERKRGMVVNDDELKQVYMEYQKGVFI